MMTALILCAKLCVVAVAAANAAAADDESWMKFGSNVNYRFSAILDVNGGAVSIPAFASPKEEDAIVDGDGGQMRTATTSAGCK